MPRTKEQFQGIREEKKALIMRVALELFATNGFHGTTISSIAEKAGISKGLVYNYFDSKEDLIRVIIYSGLESIGDLMDPNHDGVITGEEMENLLDSFFDFLQRDLNFWKLYFSLLLQIPIFNLVKDKLNEIIKNYIGMLEAYFETKGCEDPYTEAILFGATLDGIGFNYIANADLFPVDKIKKRILTKFK